MSLALLYFWTAPTTCITHWSLHSCTSTPHFCSCNNCLPEVGWGFLRTCLIGGWIKYLIKPLLDVILPLFHPLSFTKEWSMVIGPAGLPGHHALGLEDQEVAPVQIPLLRMGGKTALVKPQRPLTVNLKSCNTWSWCFHLTGTTRHCFEFLLSASFTSYV